MNLSAAISAKRVTPGRPYQDDSQPIVWAVWLGANTPKRLAHEWGIGLRQAAMRLSHARRCGWIVRHASRGTVRYRVVRCVAPRGCSYGGLGMDPAHNLPSRITHR